MGRNNGKRRQYSEERLRRAVKNFNAKVKRLQAKGAEGVPEKLSYKTIARNIMTKEDLKVWTKNIESFNKRNGEGTVETNYGYAISKFEAKMEKYLVRRRNEERVRQNQELYDKYDNRYRTIGGIKQHLPIPGKVQSVIEKNEPYRRTPSEYARSKGFYNKRFGTLTDSLYQEQATTKAQRMYDNFKSALEHTYKGRIPNNLYRKLINLYSQVTPMQLTDMYYRDILGNVISFVYHYKDATDIIEKARWSIEQFENAISDMKKE